MINLKAWWMRIVLMVVLTVALVMAASLLPYTALSYPLIMVGLLLVVVGIELARPGGSIMSSGIGVSVMTARHTAYGIVISLLSLGSIAGVALAMGARFKLASVEVVSSSTSPAWVMITTMVTASVSEELFFRGTIFEAIKDRFTPLVALIITSVLFGAAHSFNPGVSPLAIVNVTLAGVLMAVMVYRSASLWMPMAFHASWNVLTAVFFGSVSGTTTTFVSVLDTTTMQPELVWFVSGPFGIEQGLLTSVLLVGASAATLAFVKKDSTVLAARLRRDRTTSPTTEI